MRPALRVLSFSLSVAVAVAALPCSEAFADDGPAESDDLARAQELYKKGTRSYELADYGAALELWKEAYQILPDVEGSGAIRHALVYNMADAETKQFEIDQDVSRLRKARMLLQEYIESHEEIYGTTEEAKKDKANAEARLVALEQKIAEVEAGATPGVAAPAPTPVNPNANTSPGLERRKEINADPELKALERRYTAFIAGGATMLAVGVLVGLVGLGIIAANAGDEALNQASGGTTGDNVRNGTGLAVTLVGVGLIGGGIPLVAIGDQRRRKLRNPTVPLPDTSSHLRLRNARVAPYANQYGGGARFGFSF